MDDDLVVVGGAAQLAPNENCPITGRAVRSECQDGRGVGQDWGWRYIECQCSAVQVAGPL